MAVQEVFFAAIARYLETMESSETVTRKQWRPEFLAALAETGIVTRACEAAGISRMHCYRTKGEDRAFAEQWRLAEETFSDRLEAEAIRRAMHGWDEPVFRDGRQIGAIRKYSDRLLAALLSANRPRKFSRQNQLEISGNVNVDVGERVTAALDAIYGPRQKVVQGRTLTPQKLSDSPQGQLAEAQPRDAIDI